MCRLLKAEEIECRVAQVSAKGCSLLLYKTARTDATILTETYGELWQNDFKVIDGKMYGGIGVWNKELSQWIWRWDCGTESNTEAEKGQASDCFKRAGFKFLIGQELYKAPFIWVNCETEQNNGKYRLKDKYKFDVKEIGCDSNRNINKLVITDINGNTVFEMGKYIKIPEETPEVKDDTDIFAGLTACSDLANLKKYWEENKNKVKDRKRFDKLKDELKATMIS